MKLFFLSVIAYLFRMMEENILFQGDMCAEVCLCTNINLETRKQDALILNIGRTGFLPFTNRK